MSSHLDGDRKRIPSGIGPSDRVKDDKIQLRRESVLSSGLLFLALLAIDSSKRLSTRADFRWLFFNERAQHSRMIVRLIGARVIAFRLIDSTTFHRASAS